MRLFRLLASAALLFAQAKTFAQTAPLYLHRNLEAAYEKSTRSLDGTPGTKYWQNRADYVIRITLEPKKRLVRGSEDITYFNNSPDTLDLIRLKLQHDLYRKGGQRNSDIEPSDVTDEGVIIKDVQINGEGFPGARQRRRNSFLDLRLEQNLPPKTKMTLRVDWEFTMPAAPDATRECVCDPTSFFIPYFYPQIAVYDDTHGWAETPYNGLQEFYHEFANYDVRITTPAGYMVWATGEWQNAPEILAPGVFEKWKRAHEAADVVPVFTEAELKSGTVFRKNGKQTEFRFLATDVPDFTFAASDHYNFDATSALADDRTGRRVLVGAAYDSKSKDFYQVARIAADGVRLMSTWMPGYPFPYPSLTVFNGNDGMEYPMMINDASVGENFVHDLTLHEASHTYMPFMMGTNEQYYAWMDEGWANFFEDCLSDSLKNERGFATGYNWGAGCDHDVPPMVPTRFLSGPAFGIQSYSRPQAAYTVLYDLLGYDEFHRCLTAYFDRWKSKHPIPYDFFYTFNNVSGQDLNWFWKPWFFEHGYPDLGIKSVEKNPGGLANQIISVEKRGAMPVPVFLSVEYSDGTREQFHRRADVWKNGGTVVQIPCAAGKIVKSATLGNNKTPDAKQQDNNWKG